MLLIHCPCCNETREQEEFSAAGEAFIARAGVASTDAEWGDYLFNRRNPKGWHWEQWLHAAGCRKVLVVRRHTVTNEIAGSWTLADAGTARRAFETESSR